MEKTFLSKLSHSTRQFFFFTLAILTVGAIKPMKVGSDTYGEITVESLDILGSVKLNGTTIAKLLKITGNLCTKGAHLYQLEAEGDVKLNDTILEKEAKIIGSLQATDSQFKETLFFMGQKALLSNCEIKSITVRRDGAFKAKQVLELKSGTIVDGPIVFEGGNGTVILYSGAKIRGSVTGGKITYKNQS